MAWLTATGGLPAPVCRSGLAAQAAPGSWLIAFALAALVALGSALILRRWPGQAAGGIYNAAASVVISALLVHFSGGSPDAHILLFILTSLLLYYRARWPVALAGGIFVSYHLGFYTLQEAGAPVFLFACPESHVLLIHLAAGIGQYTLLGYIAARMERKDAYLRLAAAQQELAASVFHNAIEGIVITDAKGRIVSVNPAFTEITGYTAEEAIGETPRLLKSNRHDEQFYREMWATIESAGQWKGKIWNRRKCGEVFLESQTIRRLRGEDGVIRYVAVFNDITEQWRKDQRIEHLAFYDSLTGLANRSLLNDRIQHSIALAERSGSGLAVLVLDLDRFKNINDTLGHDQGDKLLQIVSERLRKVARETDTVARLGGDEFVLLLENPGRPEEIGAVAARVVECIAEPMVLGGVTLCVEGSLGVAIYPIDGEDAASLMKNADTAMYDAKASGKNTYRFFSSSMTDRAKKRLHLEMDLRRALEQQEFELHYQPKVCLATGAPTGAEALIRWRHPERGLVSPMEFIPLAEETGLIEPMGEWVLEEACRQLCVWRTTGAGIANLAVNVSAIQIQRGRLAEHIRALLGRYGLPGSMLEIELTESTLMDDPERAIEVMNAVRSAGVKIAIDDFGTGYSSLAYLSRLPIDTLKIDRSFVNAADRSANGRVVCDTIIGLGRNLHLQVVAEGIETPEQLAYLRQQGCYAGQGYHFCRPLPEDEFSRWLGGWRANLDIVVQPPAPAFPAAAHEVSPPGGMQGIALN
ncbi:MAG TPA: EAL domain-containing protein [Noviherbaspirillum sp.]|uniref:putative bifunctional diguanylate cyclase/phosphodiesterase n=1 Tax=Noviherbaspirillum sp. TaxID=1926288 RepID=UPI002D757D13|nr:EAL domain-containing protein [Noviherbaspirillum sp.]HYD96853.1 EAL domain-containing protein [Noviherbaspirillum sp.]